MNSRLTIRDIAGLLAEKTGRSSESVELFLKEFITVARENVFADRLMQIKGIGTFKIIRVDKRESVDVNTKERIVIAEHYKLSFAPDKELREIVNKPFSFFESIEINEDSDFTSFEMPVEEKDEDADDTEETEDTDDAADAITDAPEEKTPIASPVETKILASRVVKEEEPKEPEKPKEPEVIPPPIVIPPPVVKAEPVVVPEPVVVRPEPVIIKPEPVIIRPEPVAVKAEPVIIPGPVVKREEPIVKEETIEPPSPPPPIIIEKETINHEINKEEKVKIKEKTNLLNENNMNDYNDNRRERDTYTEKEYKSNNNTLVILLLVLVVILIIALGSLLVLKKDAFFGSGVASTQKESAKNINQFALPDDDFTTDDDSLADDNWGEGTDSTGSGEPAAAASTLPTKDGMLATITTKKGDRLNLLALEYYGNKLFWVYIYEQNKSKIANPDNIEIGVVLDIPEKSTYNIDANNAESVRQASVKQTQIMRKFKPQRRRSYSSYNNYQYSNPYMYQGGNAYGSNNYDYNNYGTAGTGNQYDNYSTGTTNQYDNYNTGNQYNSEPDPFFDTQSTTTNQYNQQSTNQQNSNDYDPFLY